jgi:putative colanic acid biosynthesis UDP-glucose lipid carrier transferase
VKPGITGWAQVHGLRGEIRTIEQLERRVHYDRDYIARWSMFLDMKIVAMTLFRVANDPNAY